MRSLNLLPGAFFSIPSFVKCRCFLQMMAFINCQLIVIRATATSGTPLLLMHLWRTGMKAVLKYKICGWEIFSKNKKKAKLNCLIGFEQLLHVGLWVQFISRLCLSNKLTKFPVEGKPQPFGISGIFRIPGSQFLTYIYDILKIHNSQQVPSLSPQKYCQGTFFLFQRLHRNWTLWV